MSKNGIYQNLFNYMGQSGIGNALNTNATKESRIQSVIETATNTLTMVFGAMANAEEEARKNVSEAERKNNNLEKSTQNQVETNKRAIETIIDKINENEEKIKEILKTINDFEEEKEDINKEVEAHQKEIQKQKEAYENATTQEERDKALAAISTENQSVKDLLGRVEAISKQQKELNKQGEEFKTINGDLETEGQETKEDGENKIKALNTQAVANKAESATLAGHEAKYAAKAAEYTAKAAAVKSSGFLSGLVTLGAGAAAGEATAQYYMQLAQQNLSAAGIIGSGVPGVISTITNIFDGTNTNLGYLTNASSAIGSLTSAANGDIEGFFGIANAIGSWVDNAQNGETTSKNIETAVKTAQQENQEEKNTESQDSDNENKQTDEKKKLDVDVDFGFDAA